MVLNIKFVFLKFVFLSVFTYLNLLIYLKLLTLKLLTLVSFLLVIGRIKGYKYNYLIFIKQMEPTQTFVCESSAICI